MSRKLLMNNSSGGLMPVQDGLVCWLDGRDGKNGDTVWKDRSGNGNDFVIDKGLGTVNYKNGTIEFRDGASIYKDLPFTTVQLSFIFFRSPHNSWQYIMDSRIYNQDVYIASNNYSSSIERYGVDIIKRYVNAIETNGMLINGTKTNLCITKKTSNLSKLNLFNRSVSSVEYINIDCYSILVYNRALTDSEIKQNYEYEKSIQRG